MRSPIRLKNFRMRFAPYYVLGAAMLAYASPSVAGFLAGACLVMAGGALRAWGAGHLVKNDRLTITGPYARMRHPLYAGTLLVGIGFVVMVGGWFPPLLLAVFLAWFFWVYFPRKERIESERLERLYGVAYREYREHVPALVPALSVWRPTPAAAPDVETDGSWSPRRYLDNNELGTLLALTVGLIAFALRLPPA